MKLEGVVTTSDLLAAIGELCARAGPVVAFDALWDARAVTGLVVGIEDVPALLAGVARFEACLGRGRTAWLAPRAQPDFTMIMTLLALKGDTGRRQRMGFAGYVEALSWLAEGRLERRQATEADGGAARVLLPVLLTRPKPQHLAHYPRHRARTRQR